MAAPPKPRNAADGAAALLARLENKIPGGAAGDRGGGRGVRAGVLNGVATRVAGRSEGQGGRAGGAYDAQGTHPPVLSDAKIEFVQRRWLQTLLGGPKVCVLLPCALLYA